MSTINKPKTSILRKILYILACVFVIILIAGIFMPKDISTSISKEVDYSNTYAFNVANNHLTVPKCSAWVLGDKETVVTYDKLVQGANSGYSWKSKKYGDGSIKYTKVVPNEKIEAELMMQGQKSTYIQTFKFLDKNKSTVSWDFNTHMSYPKNVFAPFLMHMINKKNNETIDNMSAEVERRKKGEYYSYQVKEVGQNQRFFVTSRNSVSVDQIGQFYAQNLAAVYQKLQAEGIIAAGAPCAIFYKFDEVSGNADMAVAVPVLSPIAIKDLTSETFPAQNVVTVDYFGDSAKNQVAHYALNDYINDRKYTENYPVLEEYVTDPLKEKDPAKWLTKIYYYATEKK